MRIEISLLKDRTIPATLQAFNDDEERIVGPVKCLGKADNATAKLHGNPDRTTTRPFGDTPTGDYRVVRLVTHTGGESEVHTYGTFPSVLLDPVAGDALTAKNNGRSGLMIHGGAPGAGGKLRPTFGCIRVAEDDERDLAALIVRSTLTSSTVRITEV
jgi:lipoprotein-anchoring transpeptidase ErfK/SrfK